MSAYEATDPSTLIDLDTYERIRASYRLGCVFCAPDESLVLTTTARFGVCFDIAPVAPGHLIIHSRQHHACAGELPRDHFAELNRLRARVRGLLEPLYGAVTFYEHGRAGSCLSDGPEHRLCHHFHVHCVPVDIDITAALSARFARLPIGRYEDLTDLFEQYGPYFFVEAPDGMKSYFPVHIETERHLLRTLISQRLGQPQRADWKANGFPELLVAGMRTVTPAFRRTD